MKAADDFVKFVRTIYDEEIISLHRPIFDDREKKKLLDCIESNFVSSLGQYVISFEEHISSIVGTKYAVACVNGTAALHAALHFAGVGPGTQVITQALTFVATCNAIRYCGAAPIFVDVDIDTLGMSPQALRTWLQKNVVVRSGKPYNKFSGDLIVACLPMHTFGFPCRIDEICSICEEFSLQVIEDAAEALGSSYKRKSVGSFGDFSTISFNGNKIITAGGGGMILTNKYDAAVRLKHLTTTAKLPHPYEYFHDMVGYNYRMPNLNAALGEAQIEKFELILRQKAQVAKRYEEYFENSSLKFIKPIDGALSNNWLNGLIFHDKSERDNFLKITNDQGVLTRPIWHLISDLPMYKNFERDHLTNSKWLGDRVVNIPSSVPKID